LHTLTWIVGSSLAMSAIAWVGLVSVALNQEQLKKLLLPLVAFSAGSLLGGALLHLLPEAVAANGPGAGGPAGVSSLREIAETGVRVACCDLRPVVVTQILRMGGRYAESRW
jgi:zinc transporter ZupT